MRTGHDDVPVRQDKVDLAVVFRAAGRAVVVLDEGLADVRSEIADLLFDLFGQKAGVFLRAVAVDKAVQQECNFLLIGGFLHTRDRDREDLHDFADRGIGAAHHASHQRSGQVVHEPVVAFDEIGGVEGQCIGNAGRFVGSAVHHSGHQRVDQRHVAQLCDAGVDPIRDFLGLIARQMALVDVVGQVHHGMFRVDLHVCDRGCDRLDGLVEQAALGEDLFVHLLEQHEGRTSYGGPSEASVKKQIALAAAQLTAWEEKNA